MKKIIYSLILLVVCFLPVMVNAEAQYELDWQNNGQHFLYEKDGLYYFIGDAYGSLENIKIYAYDEAGQLELEFNLYDPNVMTEDDFYASKEYNALVPFWRYEDNYDYIYDEENKKFYEISYYDEYIYVYDFVTGENIDISFSEDEDLTREILGERYDVYNHLKGHDFDILRIDIFDNVNAVYYWDEENQIQVYVMDKNQNLLLEYNSGLYRYVMYENDGVLYFPEYEEKYDSGVRSDKISTYRLDGTKIGTFVVENALFDYEEYNYCGRYDIVRLDVKNNKIILSYQFESCPTRKQMNSVEDYVKTEISHPYHFTLKYSLEYDVETVTSSNGELSYETKVDEDGKSYVELKVVPKDGYSVEKIIVTDSNGNIIEVVNNKFYMPMNDVKIEVKYVEGEYLPIPDTFLGKSVSVIFIGLVLISLGLYTINYVRQE